MNYTPFGEYFRILLIKHHEVLNDAKEFLGVTCAYISSVECGKRAVPSDWKDKIIEHYNLNEKEIGELDESIIKSATSIKLGLVNTNSVQRNVAIQFQRSFDNLDDESAKQIIEILERNQKK